MATPKEIRDLAAQYGDGSANLDVLVSKPDVLNKYLQEISRDNVSFPFFKKNQRVDLCLYFSSNPSDKKAYFFVGKVGVNLPEDLDAFGVPKMITDKIKKL